MRARLALIVSATLAAPLLAVASGAAGAALPVHKLSVKVTDTSPRSASITVMNVATGATRQFTGDRQLDLRAGTYNVAVWFGQGSPSVTLADQVVNLNRNRTVTLSPTGSVPVYVSIGNPGAQEESLELAPFVAGRWATPVNPSGSLPVAPVPSLPIDSTYVVPMSSKLVTLYVYSVWEQAGATATDPSPYRYDIIKAFGGGIPWVPSIYTKASQLARVDITAREFDPDQQAILNLDPLGQDINESLSASTPLGATPAHLVSYRSPGFRWVGDIFWQSPSLNPDADNEVEEYDAQPILYRQGRYAETWGQAVLAPWQYGIEAARYQHQLDIELVGPSWSDPFHRAGGGEFASQTASLYSGGRLLATNKHFRVVQVPYPSRARGYVLNVTGARLPGAGLSSSVAATWQFSAGGRHPFTRVFSVTLAAGGLSDANAAAAGSVTPVTLGFNWGTLLSYPIRAVRGWASANAGATWQPVTVRKVNGHYVLYVGNAATSGYTSLRVYVADKHGESEELTVIDAYGIS